MDIVINGLFDSGANEHMISECIQLKRQTSLLLLVMAYHLIDTRLSKQRVLCFLVLIMNLFSVPSVVKIGFDISGEKFLIYKEVKYVRAAKGVVIYIRWTFNTKYHLAVADLKEWHERFCIKI